MADVTIYTRAGCGYCRLAKQLLDEKGVSYTEHDATSAPELRREMIERTQGRTTFPQILIDGRSVGGATDLYVLEREGRLDPLLGRVTEDRA